MVRLLGAAGLAVTLLGAGVAMAAQTDAGVHAFDVKRIDGTPVQLSAYKGRVLLIVNTASKCGLTPQYEGLEKLHATYAKRGLSVLGFPSNDFFGQEPGSNAEIQQFCQTSFGVKFDMFEKIIVKGRGQAPLYRYLTGTEPHAGQIRWNFEKFLVGRDGRVVARFAPRTQPTDKAVIEAIEAALAR